MGQQDFFTKIASLSSSNDWDKAKNEWVLDNVFIDESHCICGHAIIENCVIRNKVNGNDCVVGNCCVKKFMSEEIGSKEIFSSIRKLQEKIDATMNHETVRFYQKKGVINDWEAGFYVSIMKKRKLTDSQKSKKIEINGKIFKDIMVV